MIPTYKLVKNPNEIEKVYEFNRRLTEAAKEGISTVHTENLRGTLQNFSVLMAGDFGEQETVEIPVDVMRNMALFGAVALSRLVYERMKLEKSLGRPVVDEVAPEPTAEELIMAMTNKNLTKDDSSGKIKKSETNE